MKSHVFGFALFSVAAIVACTPADAQNGSLTRSFVSSSGVDSNPCTITAPCATFARAYTQVGSNGIIAALDPGKYGALTISGPVTVNGNGWAAITGTSGNDAISITAVSGNVTLTGLELDGAHAGNHGIFLASNLTGSATLTIRDCVVSNFLDSGIAIQPASAELLYVLIANTFSLDNGVSGIRLAPTGGAYVVGSITGSTVANNNNDGLDIEGTSGISVISSIAINNTGYGVYDDPTTLAVLFRDTIATYNSSGDFYATGSGPAYLYHNAFGSFNGNSATLYSDGTNQFSNAPTGNVPTKQSTY